MAEKQKETEAEKTLRLRALRLAREAEKPPAGRKAAGTALAKGRAARVWSLKDELTFGKYQGKTIAEVLDNDQGRGWVKFALEEIKGFELDDFAQLEFDSYDDPRSPPKAWESPRY